MFADCVSKPEELLARKRSKLSFQQAATVPLGAFNNTLAIEGDNRRIQVDGMRSLQGFCSLLRLSQLSRLRRLNLF